MRISKRVSQAINLVEQMGQFKRKNIKVISKDDLHGLKPEVFIQGVHHENRDYITLTMMWRSW